MTYKHIKINSVDLYCGDALKVLSTLPSQSVDALITDPPYSSGGMFRGDRQLSTTTKYQLTSTKKVYGDFLGDNRDQRAYLLWCTLWLSECVRVLKPGAVFALFIDWRQLPTLTDAIQCAGLVWRGVAVWDKTLGSRPSPGRYRQQAEFIVWGSNGPMSVERGTPPAPGVFTCAPLKGRKFHLAGKPLPLMQDLLSIVPSNGVVLDVFMGSGTTGLAALGKGLGFIGVELSPHYFDVAHARLSGVQPICRDS